MKYQIEAVIFDMDGLIINSEPLWRKAEIAAFKTIGYNFTEEMCIQTMGMRIDEVVHYWWEEFKWTSVSEEMVVKDIHSKMIDLIKSEGAILTGVEKTLKLLKDQNIPLALASSSSKVLIETVLNVLNIKSYFTIIHSAQDEKAGKPDPSVFLTTARLLKVDPEKCLVLEDSKAGMDAGLSANMRTIVVPEKNTYPEWSINAYTKLNSMNDFSLELLK